MRTFLDIKRSLLLFIFCVFCMAACQKELPQVVSDGKFEVESFNTELPFATPDVIKVHEKNLLQEYYIGPGDVIKLDIWNRQKLSGEHIVGPYGKITLPMLGNFKISGLNRKTAAEQIKDRYRPLYSDPIVTVKILKYLNNKVYVLGRVANPGVIHFSGSGTLLEALAMSGGLPTRDKTIFLSKCYIVRGKNQIIWIDLLQLLNKANIKLNIQLANNDIIYIPESMDAAVFVMGEVRHPGSYQVQTTGLSVLDVINLAGGPTENANVSNIRLIRDLKEQRGSRIINLDRMLHDNDMSTNYLLRDNDILFIPQKGIAKFNYYLRQIDPFMRTFISGALINNALNE